MKMTRTFLILLAVIQISTPVFAEDGIYVTKSDKATKSVIENGSLVVQWSVEKIPVPRAKKITLSGKAEIFYITIDLEENQPETRAPIIFVGGSVISEGVTVSGNGKDDRYTSIEIKSKDKAKAKEWFLKLKTLFGIKDGAAKDFTEKNAATPLSP